MNMDIVVETKWGMTFVEEVKASTLDEGLKKVGWKKILRTANEDGEIGYVKINAIGYKKYNQKAAEKVLGKIKKQKVGKHKKKNAFYTSKPFAVGVCNPFPNFSSSTISVDIAAKNHDDALQKGLPALKKMIEGYCKGMKWYGRVIRHKDGWLKTYSRKEILKKLKLKTK